MDPAALQASINNVVTAELERFHCTVGQLRCESRQGGDLLTLHGRKEDGRDILIWPDAKNWRSLCGRYLDTLPDAAGFTLDINLSTGTYRYKTISPAEIYSRDQRQEQDRKQDAVEQKNKLKKDWQVRTAPVGRQLAEKVAATLHTRSLLNSHRDYCGMGLEFRDNEYHYGEVYDGGLDPLMRFANQKAFVDWLSRQSDASLARLEEKDAFYWGNQTITREMLEGFVNL